jgi:DNA-directed RNA polymerase subunit N (RpoN/RPB10)
VPFNLPSFRIWLAVLALVCARHLLAAPVSTKCPICGRELGELVYILTDKVNEEKIHICQECGKLPHDCFICGLPVKHDFTELPDGRVLCARDAKNAVLDDDEAKKICDDVKEALDRLLSRFVTFPGTNVETSVVDRVNLQALFKVPGNDYECPNILGYTRSRTNFNRIEHQVSLMSGLPRAELKSVCAHELSHTWVFENVPGARKKTLSRDAHEAFCELIAYKLMNSEEDEDQKTHIRKNRYTRGQIDLFIEAGDRYGFNEIVDWMKYGVDSALHADDLNRVRNTEIPAGKLPKENTPRVYSTRTAPSSTAVALKGITWNQNRPLAVINDRTFAPKEMGGIRVGHTNAVIRCLSINKTSVRIQFVGSGEERDLVLPPE